MSSSHLMWHRLVVMFSYIFLYCKSLTKIVIPLSITAETFGGSEALKNIVILPYVVSIGSGSFYDCISLNPPLHTLQSYNVSSLLPISSDLVSCNFFVFLITIMITIISWRMLGCLQNTWLKFWDSNTHTCLNNESRDDHCTLLLFKRNN